MKKLLLTGILLFGSILSFGVDKFEEAKKACDAGNAKECYSIGFRLDLVQNDQLGAIKYYEKACTGGNGGGCTQLGHMYKNSKAIEHDDSKSKKYYKIAMKHYKKSCDNGDTDACEQLGANYNNAYGGVQKDEQLATHYYGKAAKIYKKACYGGGDTSKCFSLANMYSYGNGVEQNDYTAAKYYIKACNDGYIRGCYSVGYLYSIGQGVMQNSKEAYRYYMKAAKHGDPDAQLEIGTLYYSGQGVRKNYILAYVWYSLAASNGRNVTEMINKLESIMTPNQIAIAQNYNPLEEESGKNQNGKQTNTPQISTGTGFFINSSIVLTNHHVIKECKNIELIHKGYSAKASIIADDSRNDLAILKASKENTNSLRFRAGKGIRIGEEVIVLGYPLGKLLGSSIKLTTGDVSSLNGLVDDTTNMQITAPVQPGNSGGPLLDKAGNIVGVIYSRLDKTPTGRSVQNVNLAIKSYIAQMFLDTNNIDYSVDISKGKKDVADIVEETKESIVQVVCHH